MATTTPNYSFQKPTVSGDSGVWGGYLNANWASIDSLLGGDTVITGIDINSGTIDGATVGATTAASGAFTTLSASGTFTFGGVAITATGAEINYLDGVTSNIQTQLDASGVGDVTLNGVQTLTNKDLTSGTNTFPTSLATLTGTQTLTNKTIAYGSNTLTDVAGTTATQTLTNKTIRDTVYALSGTAFDATNGAVQTKTLAANTTFTDSLTSGDAIVLQLEAGASYTVTWPTMTWVTSGGNVAPTLTAKDTLVFWKVSSTLYGAYTGSYV